MVLHGRTLSNSCTAAGPLTALTFTAWVVFPDFGWRPGLCNTLRHCGNIGLPNHAFETLGIKPTEWDRQSGWGDT